MISVLLLAAVSAAAPPDSLYSSSWYAMGSTFDVRLYAPAAARADELFRLAQHEVERIEALISHFRIDSQISRLNRDPGTRLDPEVQTLLACADGYRRRTAGAFDIRFRGSIDLGGIGKGYAVDRVAELLRGRGVRAALIGAGGSSYYAIGAWRVRISDPFSPGRALSTVALRDESLSTSGNAEQPGHIIDPRSGQPVLQRAQVSVIAARATDSDALATAVFVLGADASRPLLSEARARALVIDHAGPGGVHRLDWPDPRFP